MADPKNTPQRKNRLHIISVTSRVMANFVFEFVTFVTVSTRVGLAKDK